ncbi:hypothetical protein ADIS_3146 [Lunatimonas lonarensis]|uniref:Uncharacterized protein n=1 Tax=Lunatimonas lonarensis TaxID=1232681 RepID=R7ZRB9_9BACT|nr:hypothetical protein ADIS_3146 [Lunatimonas lonarensis]
MFFKMHDVQLKKPCNIRFEFYLFCYLSAFIWSLVVGPTMIKGPWKEMATSPFTSIGHYLARKRILHLEDQEVRLQGVFLAIAYLPEHLNVPYNRL